MARFCGRARKERIEKGQWLYTNAKPAEQLNRDFHIAVSCFANSQLCTGDTLRLYART